LLYSGRWTIPPGCCIFGKIIGDSGRLSPMDDSLSRREPKLWRSLRASKEEEDRYCPRTARCEMPSWTPLRAGPEAAPPPTMTVGVLWRRLEGASEPDACHFKGKNEQKTGDNLSSPQTRTLRLLCAGISRAKWPPQLKSSERSF
jgi:hypothetical protein